MEDNIIADEGQSSATTQLESEFKDTCMLVSDSNETSKQLDSKQLRYDVLVEFAEDNLFKKFLDMSSYLTMPEYGTYKGQLEDKFRLIEDLEKSLPNMDTNPTIANHKPKFRAVHGQVILIEADSIPSGKTPEDYVREKWDIPTNYRLLLIPDCALRGMLDTKEVASEQGNKLVAEKSENKRVKLEQSNMPPHMHHSAVTTGATFTTMKGVESQSSYYIKGNTTYDMFYNDSMDVGLNKNELEGTIDEFVVQSSGGDSSGVMHDNMPKYHAFYGFVVQDITKQV